MIHPLRWTRSRLIHSVALAAVAASVTLPPLAWAGGLAFRQQQVGGVDVDAAGVLRSATPAERQEQLAQLRREIREADGPVAQAAGLRMVSLRGLQNAMREHLAAPGGTLPEEVRYLAGLQRIEYVLVYPDAQDIVLAGPAEAWRVREDAAVVGVESGRPVILLDDLMVALQSVEAARQEGLTCSIEPTAEGYQRLQALLNRVRLRPGQNPAQLETAMRQAFGPQQIKLTGVPAESHFARILVAADYQMKRVAMHLEPSPVAELPSYLEMVKNGSASASANPRWWMACNYDALERTDDSLAWHLSGQGVKTLTETDLVSATGEVTRTGKSDQAAQRWADLMTDHFERLAVEQPVFGQLRNLMDLAVVATLISQENLTRSSGCDLSLLLGKSDQPVATARLNTPRAVEPQCSFVRGRNGWVVTASGGVQVNAFEVVEQQKIAPQIATVRDRAAAQRSDAQWWWNG